MRLSRLLPLCAALSGCALEPDDPVYLSGTALAADGSPWRGGPLTLLRPRKVDVHSDEYNQERYSTRYEPWAEVTTDADGLFLHRVDARDVGADMLEHPHPWTSLTLFQLHLPRTDGGRDFLAFEFASDVDLPPLRPWEGHVRTEDDAGGVRLFWEPGVPTADIPEAASFVLVRGEDGLAWKAQANSGEATLDAELLEDFADHARVQTRAKGTRRWFRTSLYYDAVSESAPVPLPFSGVVPVSRGAGCSVKSGAFQPCPFTDGRLEATQVVVGGDRLPADLFLQLKAPVRPRRVVVRGLNGFGDVLYVEGSTDGKTWRPLGESRGFVGLNMPMPYEDDPRRFTDVEQFLDVPLAADAPVVSHLRLWMSSTYSNGEVGKGSFSELREVSVFGEPASG